MLLQSPKAIWNEKEKNIKHKEEKKSITRKETKPATFLNLSSTS